MRKTVSGDVDITGPHTREWKEEMKAYKRLELKSVSGSINVKLGEDAKNVYVESSKLARDMRRGKGF